MALALLQVHSALVPLQRHPAFPAVLKRPEPEPGQRGPGGRRTFVALQELKGLADTHLRILLLCPFVAKLCKVGRLPAPHRPRLPDGFAVCEVEVLGHGDHGLADIVPSKPAIHKKDEAVKGDPDCSRL